MIMHVCNAWGVNKCIYMGESICISTFEYVYLPGLWIQYLTLKHRETHGCVVSTVATDALVLKHQAISILSTD